MNENMALRLGQQADLQPGKPAIIDWDRGRHRVWTFADLACASAQTADLFRSSGLACGDVVLLAQPMSAELYILLLGAWRAGLTAMFIDPGQTRTTVNACVSMIPPRALAGPWMAHAWALTSRALGAIPTRITTRGWWPRGRALKLNPRAPGGGIMEHRDAADPALITFTSGSTGQPKAIVRSHGFLARQHAVIERELRLEPGQVDLAAMPIFLLANLASGVTSVIPRGPVARPAAIDPAPVLAQAEQFQVTRGGASPAFWEILCNAQAPGRKALAQLKQVFTGGGPVYPDLMRQLQAAAPDARIVAVYGSTEAEPIATLALDDLPLMHANHRSLLPLGRPVPGMEVKIMRDQWGRSLAFKNETDFQDALLAPGRIGEIIVSGPLVIPGYWQGRGDQETKIRAGNVVWHRTGDAGCCDNDGNLWLAGRCSAKANLRGRTIYPLELDLLGRTVAGVRRVALIQAGQQPVVVVETGDPGCLSRLQAALSAAGLSGVPVHQIKKMPMDRRHNAKIDYSRLPSLYPAPK